MPIGKKVFHSDFGVCTVLGQSGKFTLIVNLFGKSDFVPTNSLEINF